MNDILSPDQNPAYGNWKALPVSLWTDVPSLSEGKVNTEALGIVVTDGTCLLPFLGKTLLIHTGKRCLSWQEIKREPTFQEGLVALNYLVSLKPIDLSRKWVSPSELPGGRTFFSPRSHPPKTREILLSWTNYPETFRKTMESLRGVQVSQGDDGYQIPCLPKVPLRYIFWNGEAGLPPAVTLLVNATAHLFLPLDVLWALTNLTDQCFEVTG
jgi:hypothetical protein